MSTILVECHFGMLLREFSADIDGALVRFPFACVSQLTSKSYGEWVRHTKVIKNQEAKGFFAVELGLLWQTKVFHRWNKRV